MLGKLFGAKASVTKAGIESFNVTAGLNSSEAGISGFTAGIKEKSDFRLRQDAKLAQDDIRSNDKSTVEIGRRLYCFIHILIYLDEALNRSLFFIQRSERKYLYNGHIFYIRSFLHPTSAASLLSST